MVGGNLEGRVDRVAVGWLAGGRTGAVRADWRRAGPRLSSSPSRCASRWATRSAILRVLTKTSVVRCSSTWPAMRSSTSENCPPLATDSSSLSGSSMATSRSRRWPQSMTVVGRRVGSRARQQAGHHLEGALGRREPDPLQSAAVGRDEVAQPLEGEGEVGPRLSRASVWTSSTMTVWTPARTARDEAAVSEQVQGLGSRHQQVRRRAPHRSPLGRRGVAGAHRDGQVRPVEAETRRLRRDAGERDLQVLVDVDGEGAQRRDVDDARDRSGAGFRRRESRRRTAASWAR